MEAGAFCCGSRVVLHLLYTDVELQRNVPTSLRYAPDRVAPSIIRSLFSIRAYILLLKWIDCACRSYFFFFSFNVNDDVN